MGRVSQILDKALSGGRISVEEGVYLYNNANLLELGNAANLIKRRKMAEIGRNPDMVTFVVDRNINYTNVCSSECKFCNFYRTADATDAYVLSNDQIGHKIEELLAAGGTQILIQGGVNPDLKLDYYIKLFQYIKSRYPTITVHGLSAVEILNIAKFSDKSVHDTLKILHEAGLDSVPGAGAEMLVDRVRDIISPYKMSSADWLNVMEEVHRLGMNTSSTMVYGSVETLEERFIHLDKLRQLQDKTKGFTAFILWPFQPDGTELQAEIKDNPDLVQIANTTSSSQNKIDNTGFEYIKMVALSRIMLDNFSNIQASWVTQGLKMGQVSLSFGTNDMGGTMMEENVVSQAGTVHYTTQQQLIDAVRKAGFTPAKRDTKYNILEIY